MYLMKWYMEWLDCMDKPNLDVLLDEWREMMDERVLSIDWFRELGDVVHTLLRMIHPKLGMLVIPVARKHGYRMRYGKGD